MVTVPTLDTLFLATSSRYLSATCLDKIERVMPLLSDDDIWWRPHETSNSVGNLILHLAGSLRFWIVSVVGGAANARVREQEFETSGGATREELLATLRLAVTDATDVLARLTPADLTRTCSGFAREMHALEAIHHGVAHFAMHTGQIVQLVKIRKGIDLGLPL
jgi:uncharacterized damage-inducible protein DinB